MKKLRCSAEYYPNILEEFPEIENLGNFYTCYDNKIHIRFHDYNSEQLIYGFEKKLTYLITYLMNYCYLPKIVGKYSTKDLLDNFLKSSIIQDVNYVLTTHFNDIKFKGLQIKLNYKQNVKSNPFGNVTDSCFPLGNENNILMCGNLATFLKLFKCDSLDNYLFDNNLIIRLSSDSFENMDQKFINKAQKKQDQKTMGNFKLTELW